MLLKKGRVKGDDFLFLIVFVHCIDIYADHCTVYTGIDVVRSEPVLDSTSPLYRPAWVSPAVALVLLVLFYAVIGFAWFFAPGTFSPFYILFVHCIWCSTVHYIYSWLFELHFSDDDSIVFAIVLRVELFGHTWHHGTGIQLSLTPFLLYYVLSILNKVIKFLFVSQFCSLGLNPTV